jgi:hypothetical protein
MCHATHCQPGIEPSLLHYSLWLSQLIGEWRAAKQDPKWHDAMLEGMAALEKNKTWELVSLPKGKKPKCEARPKR